MNANNLSECLKKCQQDKNCEAFSYNDSNSNCYLFTNGTFYTKSLFNLETIVKEKRETKILDLGKQYRYKNKKVSNPFLSLGESSERSCWIKCCEVKECIAISYKNGDCLLNKKENDFFLEPGYAWITISNEKQSIEPIYFNRSQIHGFYLTFNKSFEKSCWAECLEKIECIAISYGSEEGRCHLTKKGEYKLGRYDNWVTIYKEYASLSKLLPDATYPHFRLLSQLYIQYLINYFLC